MTKHNTKLIRAMIDAGKTNEEIRRATGCARDYISSYRYQIMYRRQDDPATKQALMDEWAEVTAKLRALGFTKQPPQITEE